MTPYTSNHAPIKKHLITTCTATPTLVATLNTPHITISTFTKYNTWSPTLLPSQVLLKNNILIDICRKHANLCHTNRSAIRILSKIKRQLINTIGRHKTYTINHDFSTSQLRRAYQATRPRILSAQQLCIAATHPQNPGEEPITTWAIIIPGQIKAIHYTYGRQMTLPHGWALFYGTLSHDASDSAGVIMHPNRHFTAPTSRNTTHSSRSLTPTPNNE